MAPLFLSHFSRTGHGEGVAATLSRMTEIKPSLQYSSDRLLIICEALKRNDTVTSIDLSDNPTLA